MKGKIGANQIFNSYNSLFQLLVTNGANFNIRYPENSYPDEKDY